MLQLYTRKIEATGDDQEINLGFKPSWVKVINKDKVGTEDNKYALEWFDGMDEGEALEYYVAKDSGSEASVQHNDSAGIKTVEKSEVDEDGDQVTFDGFFGIEIPGDFSSENDTLFLMAARK